jgi:hypothetical protein
MCAKNVLCFIAKKIKGLGYSNTAELSSKAALYIASFIALGLALSNNNVPPFLSKCDFNKIFQAYKCGPYVDDHIFDMEPVPIDCNCDRFLIFWMKYAIE